MSTKNINLTQGAKMVIENLQHPCGTYTYYDNTLKRLFNHVLVQSDEIGMDDTEAMHTLRVLHNIREDLAILARHERPQALWEPVEDPFDEPKCADGDEDGGEDEDEPEDQPEDEPEDTAGDQE